MVLVMTRGGVHVDIGGIAMLVIALGLLERGDRARRWGIGRAWDAAASTHHRRVPRQRGCGPTPVAMSDGHQTIDRQPERRPRLLCLRKARISPP